MIRFVAAAALLVLCGLEVTLATPDTAALRDAVTVAGIREHQAAFQAIADANGGVRTAGSAGHDQSADYVAGLLATAGYDVTLQSFAFDYFEETAPPALEQIAPLATVFATPADFITMSYSGSGDVTAPVVGVDLVLPPAVDPNTSTSGCEPVDFAGFPAGAIALLQRGACSFALKASNAEAAGAVGVIIFNEGQPGRTEAIAGTLSLAGVASVPVVGTSFDVGVALSGVAVIARLRTQTISESRVANNVLAEAPWTGDGRVVLAGAHLDSATPSPGINDNGSGAATILEIALQLAANPPVGPVHGSRFAFWGADEHLVNGSRNYVAGLDAAGIAALVAYLDFASLGSPNYVRFVLDGDGSGGGLPGAPGSARVETTFLEWFANEGLAVEPLALPARHGQDLPFTGIGVPVGGLTGGHEAIKTADQAATFGGTAGEQYDPCFHLACDTYDNVSLVALDELSDAAAHAILSLIGIDADADGVEDCDETNLFSTATTHFAGSVRLFHQNGYASPGVEGPIAAEVSDLLPQFVGLDALDRVSETEVLFSVRPGGLVPGSAGPVYLLENQPYLLDLTTAAIAPDPGWAALGLRLRTLDAVDRLGDGSYLFSTGMSELVTHAGGRTYLRPWIVYRAVPDPGGVLVEEVLNAGLLGFSDVDAVDGLADGRLAISSASNGWGPGPGGTIRIWNQNVYVHDPADPGLVRLSFDGVGLGLRDLDAFTLEVTESP